MSIENEKQDLPEEDEIDREEQIFKRVQGCSFILMAIITVLIFIILLFVRFYL